ncbi:restriction endonuclease subunit S [Extensimonas sp. H3M7-6]|uniref:restriction endonuclease subunit S n=1 Tax=Extensimonas soli TaxID=3031322 RepID=UPI0023DC6B68|nr:restriction endonuclease subunit S [Extensimonas sp. H3M7-6]MDF1483334.1 restriction endonuclease subunit S [Extensimonas sp. H3M7-6]
MSSEWVASTVGEFCPFKYGKGLPERARVAGSFPVMSSAGVVASHKEPLVNSAGIVIGRKGTAGSVTFAPGPFWPIDTAFYVEDDPENRDIRFTYYLLKTLGLSEMNSDSAVPGLNRENAHAVAVRIPSLAVQAQIAHFLGTLDDRITLLRETNATLDAIAQALFKSWFVDFDPVRAKMEGRAPEGMDEATAALFPDSFEETELGVVPRGWRVGVLSDVASLNAQSWTARNAPAELNYIDLSGVKNNVFDAPQTYAFSDAPSRARRVLRSGDCIVGTVRPGNRSFGFIAQADNNLTGSTGFAVLSPKQTELVAFVYLCATREENIDRLASLADGGAYPAVKPELVAATKCVLPTDDVMKEFDGMAKPLLASISANSAQAQTLSTLRDTLLPRLISGQLRLPEAQAAAEEALA